MLSSWNLKSHSELLLIKYINSLFLLIKKIAKQTALS